MKQNEKRSRYVIIAAIIFLIVGALLLIYANCRFTPLATRWFYTSPFIAIRCAFHLSWQFILWSFVDYVWLVLIYQENDQIQGAILLGQNSVELINIVKLAMDHHILAKALVNQVFPHPTMAENLNDFISINHELLNPILEKIEWGFCLIWSLKKTHPFSEKPNTCAILRKKA